MKLTRGAIRQEDRVMTPKGWGKIIGEYNNDPNKVGWWEVELEYDYAKIDVPGKDLRHETFKEYLMHPGGPGRFSWAQVIVWALGGAGLVTVGVMTWSERGWIAVAFTAAVYATILFGTIKNYTRKWN